VVEPTARVHDGLMPEPARVWMVELDRSPDDVEGTLTLDRDAIRFAPAEGATTRDIDLTQVTRVKRIWGSPVLMVHSVEDGVRHVTAFYFSKPPPLHPPETPAGAAPPPTLIGPFNRDKAPSKRKQRRNNAGYLSSASTVVGDQVRMWLKEMRAAVGVARGASQT
jgi:hypothetical protein